jgi:hypothetical protein
MTNPRRTRGQGLVEAAMVLLVFFALLLGVVDCGQVLYAHQALVERVRSSVRWGTLHPYDGTGEQVANLILYDRLDEPGITHGTSRDGFLGLTRANVQVRYQPASVERPDDQMLTVAIVNYESHFFSPWIAKKIVSPRPVLISAPMAARCADLSGAAPASETPGKSETDPHALTPCVAGR